MKITSFNPIIASAHSDEIIKLYEELGFEKHHTKKDIEIDESEHTIIRMKDTNGFLLDVVRDGSFTKDITGIRINVDDFDEAYNLFISKGFKNYADDGTISTASSKFVLMTSPSGFLINLCQHIKQND